MLLPFLYSLALSRFKETTGRGPWENPQPTACYFPSPVWSLTNLTSAPQLYIPCLTQWMFYVLFFKTNSYRTVTWFSQMLYREQTVNGKKLLCSNVFTSHITTELIECYNFLFLLNGLGMSISYQWSSLLLKLSSSCHLGFFWLMAADQGPMIRPQMYQCLCIYK